MALQIVPPTAPFQVPAGSVVSIGDNLYTFTDLNAISYVGVRRAAIIPVGALSTAYLAAYGLPNGIVRPS